MATPDLLLYDHPVSSYAQKIRILLREKDIPFSTRVPVGTAAGDVSAFHAANPRGEVPVLVDGELSVFDSTIIAEYIEDKWPSPALRPAGAADKARARMVEELCDTQYEAVNWGWGEVHWMERATGELASRLEQQARGQTAQIQAWLEARLGEADYFHGGSFGWADMCVAPFVNRSRHYGFGPAKGSRLGRWLERVGKRASVAATFAEFEGAAGQMAMAKEYYKSGKGRREYRDHRLEWMIKSGGIDVVLEGLKRDNIRFSWPEGHHAVTSSSSNL